MTHLIEQIITSYSLQGSDTWETVLIKADDVADYRLIGKNDDLSLN